MNSQILRRAAIASLCAVSAALAFAHPSMAQITLAQTVKVTTTITLSGPSEQHITRYECAERTSPLKVSYINANPNFLAIFPIDGRSHLFANIISGSDVHYASAQYVWSINGIEAVLTSEIAGVDAAPLLICTEIDDTP